MVVRGEVACGDGVGWWMVVWSGCTQQHGGGGTVPVNKVCWIVQCWTTGILLYVLKRSQEESQVPHYRGKQKCPQSILV